MIEVVQRTTSICPRCGSNMVYFNTNSQLQIPDESGKHVSAVLAEASTIIAHCPKCNANYRMVQTVYGILPYQMAKEMALGVKDPEYEKYNPIGTLADIDIEEITYF